MAGSAPPGSRQPRLPSRRRRAAADQGAAEPAAPRPRLGRAGKAGLFAVSTIAAAALGWSVNYVLPGTVETLQGEEPIRVVAGYDVDVYSDGWRMALPGALDLRDQPPPETHCTDVRRWVAERGGVDIGGSFVKLVVEGRTSKSVVIRNISAKVLERGNPLAGTRVACPSAGANQSIRLYFDLDRPTPVALSEDEQGRPGDPYFRGNFVTLAKGEAVVFDVHAVTRGCACAWRLEIDALVGGSPQTVVVDESGEPFRTTGEAPRYGAAYDWAWYDAPAQFVPDKD
jgi:hypothetical protein